MKQENETTSALLELTNRFIVAWQEQVGSNPYNTVYDSMDSPCVQKFNDESEVYWLPHKRRNTIKLEGVERGMEMKIQNSVHDFYGSQYSGNISIVFNEQEYLLLQAWNEDDFIRLQENIIGHLVSQRKAKRQPSVFIGTTSDDDYVLSCCNLTGHVVIDRLSKKNQVVLAPDIATFLNQSTPHVNI
ncbi:SecY-interacting protein [Thorsellia anophelis]|uniref:Protein Syd n=1 Tax=Thorsellia anophelis DSM 18579 TaxID=1123402 RepID=A0A1I0BXU6_9GAMM|nr:SecY-interacting protein [Thorsellia anophelis]SET11937.1 SecY interacting protein Syd [Thorsellia anophelis DSM 18579]